MIERTKHLPHYKHEPGNSRSLSDNRVFSIYEDQSGELWVGTIGGGLNKFDPENETFTAIDMIPMTPGA